MFKGLCFRCGYWDYENLTCNNKKACFIGRQRKNECYKFWEIPIKKLYSIIAEFREVILKHFWDQKWNLPSKKKVKFVKRKVEIYFYLLELYRKKQTVVVENE